MSLLKHAPQFNAGEVVDIVKSLYGLDVSTCTLPSERDQNFLATTETGERFVLKIANSLEQRELLEAQNVAMEHLSVRGVSCPRVVSSAAGSIAEIVSSSGASHFVRLVTYVQGTPLAKVHQTDRVLLDLGKTLGRLTKALSGFNHPAFHRDFYWDFANGIGVITEYKDLVKPETTSKQVSQCLQKIQREFGKRLQRLPRSVIHGDANDYNVIVNEEVRTIGLIDFGDMIHSYTVGELAVALAYVVLDHADPLSAAKEVVSGYVSEWRLSDDEVESIWWLMLMRLCMSVCLAAHQQTQQPDNAYLDISQRAIQESLPSVLAVDPRVATDEFHRVNEKSSL